MLRCGVPFVRHEPVAGILTVLLRHQPVARHFGDDGCAGDRHDLFIAVDDRCLGEAASGQAKGVEQEVDGLHDQLRDRAKPRLAGRLRDSDAINHANWNEGNSRRERVPPDIPRKLFARGCGQLLAVTNVAQPAKLLGDPINPRENNRTRCHRPSERPATNFVDPGEEPDTCSPEGAFRDEIGCPHGLEFMLDATFQRVNRGKLIIISRLTGAFAAA